MLDGLDSIPWKDLTHAYGSAEDVPNLIRALQTAPSTVRNNESPLWHLFGTIWHQGTVYEATAYAVPFLIELAADRLTPDRVGILQLVAEVANGSSYRAVHGNGLNEPDFEKKKSQELAWVADAHKAVAANIEALLSIANEEDEVYLAAAHVLAQLPEHSKTVQHLLHEMLRLETHALNRAGLLLLLGQSGDRSQASISALMLALENGGEIERRAAVVSIARVSVQPMSSVAREAIITALTIDDLEESFDGLPWDAAGEVDRNELRACLDESARNEAAERLISAIESGGATHKRISTLLDLIFPRAARGANAELSAQELSPLQARAVRAIAPIAVGDHRIFFGHFPQWRLPVTRRAWADLAAGRDPVPIDMTLPILGDPNDPMRPLRPDRIWPGQRIIHRSLGLGTVVEVTSTGGNTILKVNFDEEGPTKLSLPSDGSRPRQ